MNRITIDHATCDQDGICVDVCPRKLIQMDQESNRPLPVPEFQDLCIACGHCLAACPPGAISLEKVAPQNCPPSDKRLWPASAQLDHLIRSRRSTRVFLNRSVDRADIENLLDLSRYAPSGSNTQPVHWMVLSDKDRLKELGQLVVEWMKTARDSWSTAERERMDPIVEAWGKGEDRIFRDAPTLVVNHTCPVGSLPIESCIIALSHFELAATAMGLGTCWLGFLMLAARAYPPIEAWFGLPEKHQLAGAMIVGHPAYTYPRIPQRDPVKVAWI